MKLCWDTLELLRYVPRSGNFIEGKAHTKERDNFVCSYCGRKENLVIHHINYNKKDCNHSNLICICNSCNSIANYNREWWESYYNALMFKRGYN